ncbi:MAG: hypothetical protein SVW57_11680, partial [Thermodesulfobacteriota bacterium]|nr:hypothetical protein [Thermodesulfobacteriota bacterium]
LTRAFLYEAKRVESDELNNLYVGLTRAKKALFLVGELKKRKYTHTWFNLILSSLNIGIDIDKIRAQGSMIIHTEGYLTRKTQIKSVTPCTSLRRVYTTPLLDNLKPKVKGREAIEEKEAFESFDEESFRKRLFGKALHHTLLHIGLISEGEMERVIDRALMFTNHKYGFLFGEDDLTCIRDRINDLLACSKLRPFFFQRDGIDIYNEWEVISRHSGYYRLRIPDRIIVDTQKVTVIDYKTHYSDVTFVHYKMQLREYKQILRSIFAGKIIEGILVYLQREGIKFFEV